MTVSPLARTALEMPAAPSGLAIRLGEAPLRGMITLKGDLASPNFAAAVSMATGLEIPAVRRATFSDDNAALWMAPDELMLLTPYEQVGARIDAIGAALSGEPHLALDVSDARAAFRLVGAQARAVLAKGAPVDLHVNSFRRGDLRRTRIGTVAAFIVQVADAPEAFEVFCFRSYAPHMWAWLVEAAADADASPGTALGVA